MTWIELSLECAPARVDDIESVLNGGGALAVTLHDAGDQLLVEPAPGEMPLWQRVRVAALFADWPAARAARAALAERGDHALLAARPERDWVAEHRRGFGPARFGERLWVVPTWAAPPAEGIVVRIDPGLAFGTGMHPTTRLCLEWLAGAPLAGRRVLDYGCGSGILGIAAARLGAGEVVMTDNDPQAQRAAAANAARNQLAPARYRVVASGEPLGGGFDILIANIFQKPLLTLSERFAAELGAGGALLLSGILEEQAPVLRLGYAWCPLEVLARCETWVLLAGVKR